MSEERVVYYDCFSGISGDMILGALVDSGVNIKTIRQNLEGLGIPGYKIVSRRVIRNGISGTKINIVLNRKTNKQKFSRSFNDIKNLIFKSQLPNEVKANSIEIFHRIGKAEAKIHRTTINKIHFHEIGAIDSIIDIVGGVLGMHLLNVDHVYSSALNTGEGIVKCEHGNLPVPAPATLILLKGIPCYSSGIKKELTTPTGAALVAFYSKGFGSMPNMNIVSVGYGAGKNEFKEIPNFLRIIIGEITTPVGPSSMKVIETNIDDMNPEYYEYVMDRLFKLGAVDVFFTPIYMKKNRPGILLSVIISNEKLETIAHAILTETSTYGVRYYDVGRFIIDRKVKLIKTSFGKVHVKIGFLKGVQITITPEYEDCKKIALKNKIPVKLVYEEVLRLVEKLEK